MDWQIAEKQSHYIYKIKMQQRNTKIDTFESLHSSTNSYFLKDVIQSIREIQKADQNSYLHKQNTRLESTTNYNLRQLAQKLRFRLLQISINNLISRRLQMGFKEFLCKKQSFESPLMMDKYIINKRKASQDGLDLDEKRNSKEGQCQLTQISKQIKQKNREKEQTICFPQNSFKIQNNFKKIQRQLFVANLEKSKLKLRVKDLQNQLVEVVKRQQKQIAKKSQSLKGLIEELSEKNEMIDEIKASVKTLQGRLHAQDKGILNIILQQDSELLKKVVFRLQHINDKVNSDLQKQKKQKALIELTNKQLTITNQKLKQQIQTLKEQLFEIQNSKYTIQNERKQIQITNLRLNVRLQKIKKGEKRLNQISKYKDSMSTNVQENNNSNSFKSEKKMQQHHHDGFYLHRTESMKDMDVDNKLEAIFTYLFHIDDQSVQLQSSELFDQEEKELLTLHQEKFIRYSKNHHQIKERKDRNVQNSFDFSLNSFDNAFNEAFQQKAKLQEELKTKTTRKLMSLELERMNMIEKISQLKQKQLHLRSIIFSFMKSLQLKSLKKNSQGICEVLFDFFEYSEQQKMSIFQVKNKRFFGII